MQTREGGDVQQFRGGLVFKAHRLCASRNSRLESNEEEKRMGLAARRCFAPARETDNTPRPYLCLRLFRLTKWVRPGSFPLKTKLTGVYVNPTIAKNNLKPVGQLDRCRANMQPVRQSGPDSGLSLQVKVLEMFQVVSSSLGCGEAQPEF